MAPYALYHCYDGSEIVKILRHDEIIKIIATTTKNGVPKLMVNYIDDELCVNSTLFCDEISQM